MRHLRGVLLGLAAGTLLSVVWFVLSWIWRHFGWHAVSWIVNTPGSGESGIGLFELVPPLLGLLVYGFGLEWLTQYISDTRISVRSFSVSAAVICILVILALTAFMLLFAYSTEGFLSFLLVLYGLAMFGLPLWGVIMGVRVAQRSA